MLRTLFAALALTFSSPALAQAPASLDGLSAEGGIRARGLIGLVSVRGELSFSEGQLHWRVGEDVDSSPYSATETDGVIAFTSAHRMENGEHVLWTGVYDGDAFSDVTALWTRVEGDFVHDLVLPGEVVMVFTPDAPDA